MKSILPSAAQINANVDLPARVLGVHFYEGKVFYHVQLGDDTELTVDSVCITTREPQAA